MFPTKPTIMNPLNTEKSVLEDKEVVAGRWMYGGMVAVLIGVIVETIPDFFGTIGILASAHRIGGSLVALGLGVEFVIEFRVSKYRDRLREINATLIAETVTRAAQAEERTANLQIDVAAAREREALAEKLLIDLRLDQLPRSVMFTPLKFAGVLESRPKGSVEIMYPREDAEANELAKNLVRCFIVGGWNVISGPNPFPEHPFESTPGIARVGGMAQGITIRANCGVNEEPSTPWYGHS